MVGRVGCGVGLEPDDVMGLVLIQANGSAQVGLRHGRVDLGHQEGEEVIVGSTDADGERETDGQQPPDVFHLRTVISL